MSAGEPPEWPFRRIAYILVRCGDAGPTLRIVACRLAFDAPCSGVWASDHIGVVADLAAPAGEADR
jgi:hypothetical protein